MKSMRHELSESEIGVDVNCPACYGVAAGNDVFCDTFPRFMQYVCMDQKCKHRFRVYISEDLVELRSLPTERGSEGEREDEE